jgi:hypothetical protein
VNVLSDEQYRVLAFVAACNRSSYNPTAKQVMLWRQNPEPAKAEYRTVEVPQIGGGLAGLASLGALGALHQPSASLSRMLDTMIGNQLGPVRDSLASIMNQNYGIGTRTRRELVKPAETVIDHLIRLTWLEKATGSGGSSGLRLTELGRALLRDHEQESVTQEDVSVVVLEGQDPLAYPLLVGQLANAGEGLLVDPYLKLDGLNRIVVSTQLTRLLVSGKPGNGAEVAAMQTYLDSASLGRHVEVRASTELHDRILLADDGPVLTLGTSLNGVGRTTTVLTPMPSGAREVLRETYERLWENASLVGPQSDAENDDDGETETDETDDETETDDGDGEGDDTAPYRGQN